MTLKGTSCQRRRAPTPASSCNRRVAWMPAYAGMTLYALCRAKEAGDELGVLFAGAALDARRHIDRGGPGETDGFGHVVGGEPAGKHERHLVLVAQQHAPVERRAVAAGARAVNR